MPRRKAEAVTPATKEQADDAINEAVEVFNPEAVGTKWMAIDPKDIDASAPPLPPHAMDDRIGQLEAELIVAKHDRKIMKGQRDEARTALKDARSAFDDRVKHLEEKVAYQRKSIAEYEAKLRANGLL